MKVKKSSKLDFFTGKIRDQARILAMRPARAAGGLTYKKIFLLVFYYVLVASL